MENVYKKYIHFESNLNFEQKVKAYFKMFGKEGIYDHSCKVIQEVEKLPCSNNENAKIACLLHDLGRVIPDNLIIDFCEHYMIEILDEEKLYPPILHPKISKFLAKEVFNIVNDDTLEAIECHTTLKKNPKDIDVVVFLADKLSWTEPEYSNIVEELRKELLQSNNIGKAAYIYLKDIDNKSADLKLYHIWTREAFNYFKEIYR